MENQYFTPEISDIKVGYECRMYISGSDNNNTLKQDWVLGKVTKLIPTFQWDNEYSSVTHKYNIFDFRTDYLTEEQIEKEGWRYEGRDLFYMFFSKNKIDMSYNLNLKRLSIFCTEIEDQSSNYNKPTFRGNCPSINEFCYICKLLNIK